MISRTIGLLGLLASVMALSSLVFGAFYEPLGPYMQGIMGGALDVYSLMRDYVFFGFGWVFSELINLTGKWFVWLPPAPWFHLPNFAKDLATLYLLGAGAVYRFLPNYGGSFFSHFRAILLWPHFMYWTLKVIINPSLTKPEQIQYYYEHLRSFITNVISIILGAIIFFLLVYAENQIGL